MVCYSSGRVQASKIHRWFEAQKVERMTRWQVPYALNEQQVIHSPVTATRGDVYFCPACRTPVILRQGEVKVPHFAHQATTPCQPDQILIQTARHLIQAVIRAWKAGACDRPILRRACQGCLTTLRQPLPEKVEAAALAETLTDGKPVDVALLAAGRPQAVIRIEVSRQPRRAGPLPTSPLPLIVLDAQAVIEQATRWTPRADGFRPMTCPACRQAYRRFQQAARQVSAETGIALPEIYYRYAIHPCWRCDQRMLVFAWPGGGMFSQAKPQHHPLPRTIQYRSSRMAGARYWVNT
jgi:hypothetical protein